LEDAMRPHKFCSIESPPHSRNKKALSFTFTEDLDLACPYALKA